VLSIVVAIEAGSRITAGLNAARFKAAYAAEIGRYVDDASVVLVDDRHPELVLSIARRASEKGMLAVVDAGRWKPINYWLLPSTDVAICSAVPARCVLRLLR